MWTSKSGFSVFFCYRILTCSQAHTYFYCCASGDCRTLQRSRPAGANSPVLCLLPPGRWPSLRPDCRSPEPVTSPLSHTHTRTEANISVQVSNWIISANCVTVQLCTLESSPLLASVAKQLLTTCWKHRALLLKSLNIFTMWIYINPGSTYYVLVPIWRQNM